MGKIEHLVKHRPVIDRKKGKDISQEPAMKELIQVDGDMAEEERTRTRRYLRNQGNKEKTLKGGN